MKILLTGATGQLGSAIAAHLQESGHQVTCLVRSPDRRGALTADVPTVAGDLTDTDSLTAAAGGAEAVIHTAGLTSYWSRRRADLDRINVEGTRNIVAACRAAGVARLVYTSTIGVLGYLPADTVGDESTQFNWQGMGIGYFETKREAERLVLAAEELQPVAVNPGIVFGAGDVNVNGLRMLLRVQRTGGGTAPSGATTVAVLGDVARGHLQALEHGKPGHRYILAGTQLSFRELFGRIAAVVGASAPRRILGRRALLLMARLQGLGGMVTGREPLVTPQVANILTRNRRYSSQKAVGELGYLPSPIEDGLNACWDWYQSSLRKT